MPNLVLKQFDTFPALFATLTDINGPINLTAATNVHVILKGNSTSTLINGTCTIVSAAAGTVSYLFTSVNTSIVDVYQVEFQIHWAAGGVQTVPNAVASNPTIEIDGDLAGV